MAFFHSAKANTFCPFSQTPKLIWYKSANWLSNRRDKVLAELTALEAGALKAPNGQHDDLAVAFINGLAGLKWSSYQEVRGEGVSMIIEPIDILDRLRW